ncbi:MAG: GNAT family N-acyltransferase [Bdellovibrionota bacterium]
MLSTAQNLVPYSDFSLNVTKEKELEGFFEFYTKHHIFIETNRYILKTATSVPDLEKVFQLRYKCFLQENNESESDVYLDFDGYDKHCDHIMIEAKDENRVVGTYRLLCSTYTDSFYSQNEFNLGTFLSEPGIKLELGRACIDENYRNGSVIDLLWKGVGRYCKLTNSQFLFGCSSIKTIDNDLAYSLYQSLFEAGHCSLQYNATVNEQYVRDVCVNKNFDTMASKVVKTLPPLLRSYILAGAKIHSMPAYDKEFSCYDLLTILNISEINSMFKNRYFNSEV